MEEPSDWMVQAVTTNIATDLSKTFTLDAESCDLQVKRQFKLPIEEKDGVEGDIVCSEYEINDLYVSICLLVNNTTNIELLLEYS